jgi:hypothetical protein
MWSDGFCSTHDGLLVVSTCSSMETDHSIDRIYVNPTTCESYIQASGKYASPWSFQLEFLFLWKSLPCIARCSRPELHACFIVYTPSAGYVSFSSNFPRCKFQLLMDNWTCWIGLCHTRIFVSDKKVTKYLLIIIARFFVVKISVCLRGVNWWSCSGICWSAWRNLWGSSSFTFKNRNAVLQLSELEYFGVRQ